jgi:hypothetical protein
VSYSLVNVATADAAPAVAGPTAAYLACPGATSLAITVANAAAIYQLGSGIGAPVWEESEHFAVPGVWTVREHADAIRLRSAKAGAPAQVSVSAYVG